MDDRRFLNFPEGRLQQLLRDRGWSPQEFRDRMGNDLALTTVRAWLRGGNRPYRTKLGDFLRVFDTFKTEAQLLGLEPEGSEFFQGEPDVPRELCLYPGERTYFVAIDGNGEQEYAHNQIHCYVEDRFLLLPEPLKREQKRILKSKKYKSAWNGELANIDSFTILRSSTREDLRLSIRFTKARYFDYLAAYLDCNRFT